MYRCLQSKIPNILVSCLSVSFGSRVYFLFQMLLLCSTSSYSFDSTSLHRLDRFDADLRYCPYFRTALHNCYTTLRKFDRLPAEITPFRHINRTMIVYSTCFTVAYKPWFGIVSSIQPLLVKNKFQRSAGIGWTCSPTYTDWSK